MKKSISPNYPSDPDSLRIMNDILRPDYKGVDALKYRADHEKLLCLLDELAQDTLIKRENDMYRLSLVGLATLDNEYANVIIDRSERLFECLRKFYKRSQREQITLEDLSKLADLSVAQVRECLSYMKDVSWWQSYPSDLYSEGECKVKPSEKIIEYDSFKKMISELKDRSNLQIANRKKDKARIRPVYLGTLKRGTSAWELNNHRPQWIDQLKPTFRKIMKEIYVAIENDLVALPAMGFRSVIEMVCNDQVGNNGTFASKIDKLVTEGYIDRNEKEILSSALETGHAAVHRSHFPSVKDLRILTEIVEHLLEGIYILKPAAEKLRKTTPKRKGKIKTS